MYDCLLQFINPVSLSENILRAESGFTAEKDIVFRTPPQYLDPFSFPFFSFLDFFPLLITAGYQNGSERAVAANKFSRGRRPVLLLHCAVVVCAKFEGARAYFLS